MNNFISNFKYSLLDKKEGIYIVEEGETLYDIECKFNTTKQIIISSNFLKDEVNKDDYLYIKCYNKVYEVSPRDTLKSISLKFNVKEEKILKDNKINYVYPYQKIVIEDD